MTVENREAELVITQHDEPRALIYADPPYVPSTRSSLKNKNGNRGHYYRCDMEEPAHVRLAELLHEAKGMVAVSGYPCALYDEELYSDWERVTINHMADGAKPRTEALWLNQALVEALANTDHQGSLI